MVKMYVSVKGYDMLKKILLKTGVKLVDDKSCTEEDFRKMEQEWLSDSEVGVGLWERIQKYNTGR